MEGEIMQYTNKYHSPLGGITVASNGDALTGLWFDGQKYFGGTLSAENEERDLSIFEQARRWLDIYFRGENPDFTPPLSLYATPFRLAVWEILKSISYGHVMTYGDIANIIAKQTGLKRMSAQAVGGAVGHNPVSIIIPCHRVVGSSGSLTGYAGGIDKKVKLLTLEKANIQHLFIPKKGTAL
jgi:methylated-DNA-[protein]-cysteine S-methyltransferase